MDKFPPFAFVFSFASLIEIVFPSCRRVYVSTCPTIVSAVTHNLVFPFITSFYLVSGIDFIFAYAFLLIHLPVSGPDPHVAGPKAHARCKAPSPHCRSPL